MKYSCKDCTERYVGCHADCPWYALFLEENEKRKAQIRKESQMNGFTAEDIYESKYRKRRGRKK